MATLITHHCIMLRTERRHSPRIPLYTWGILRLAGRLHPGMVLDVSHGGALFRAAYPLPVDVGTSCKLELYRADEPLFRVTTAQIAHQKRTLIGLAFNELDPDTVHIAKARLSGSKRSTVSGDKAVHYPVDSLLNDMKR